MSGIDLILGLRRLSNGLILPRHFEITMDRYWRCHADLLMANGEMLDFTFNQHYTNNWKM